MPTNLSNAKKTKGKQKIEMKMVEKKYDRVVAFSKRKTGIIEKLMEMVTMFNIHVGFLAFSEAGIFGKPHMFWYPSMEKVAERLKNPEGQENVRDESEQLGESQKKKRIEELMKKNKELSEKLKMEKEKLKLKKELRKEMEEDKMWWKNLENLPKDQMQVKYKMLVKLHDGLISRLERNNGGSSSRQAEAGQSGGGAGAA